jgi:release factor-specific protein-(glutamine-N5) methyltransferase
MALRNSRFAGFKFRRQAIIGNRIVDLFCPARGLLVEVDGHTHDPETDTWRDRKMSAEFGFTTFRVSNADVMTNLDGVLIALQSALEALPNRWPGRPAAHHPLAPSSEEEGEQSLRDAKAPSSLEEGVGGGGLVAQALRNAMAQLAAASDTPRLDAELLMAEALGVSRSELLLRHMGDAAPEGFAPLIERRLSHEPIAYILGRQEFFGLEFRVTPAVLIPRGDSEVVVEAALAAQPGARRVLDCGVGSGALLLAVLSRLEQARGVGIDRSAAARAIAEDNAGRLGLAPRVAMLLADWDQPGWAETLGGPFDLILANPPYVETDADLAPSVRDHEPHEALFAGAEGLDAYRTLIPQIAGLLTPGGSAVVEIGHAQAEAVATIAAAAGFAARLHHDLGDRPRALELSQAQ